MRINRVSARPAVVWRVAAGAIMALVAANAIGEALPPGKILTQSTAVAPDIGVGIITNDTTTVMGQAFFRDFTEIWRDKEDADNYALDIREQYSVRFGSIISIFSGQLRVYQARLPQKIARLRVLSEQAVESTHAAVTTQGVALLIIRDPDMGPDELN